MGWAGYGGAALSEETSRHSGNRSSLAPPSLEATAMPEDVKILALDHSKGAITVPDANAADARSKVSAGRGTTEIDETVSSDSAAYSAMLDAAANATAAIIRLA